MTTLLLIRHGENDFLKKHRLPGRLPGIHLNEDGRQQAAALADFLKDTPLAAIYASPLERAVETAEPLARLKGLKIQIVPALADTDVGQWQGRSWKVLRRTRAWKIVQERPAEFRFPDGESFLECQQRVVTALEQIATAHQPDETVAIIFHADPIRLAIAHFLGMPLEAFRRLKVETGSVSAFRIHQSVWYLDHFNCKPFTPLA
ncbi:MAG: histidine phosphatase family protein [Anaerolineales bacterium]